MNLFNRLAGKIAELRGLRAEMLTLNGGLNREIDNLHGLLNDFKSSIDVSEVMTESFHCWREETKIPDDPLVTVCVATYNRPKLLVGRCLPSLLNQTYRKIEVIIVGDASSEETVNTLSSIKDSRVTFVNLSQRGIYPELPQLQWLVAGTAPANMALMLANGDYITHLDDDDEHLPTRIEQLVQTCKEQDADFLWHPFWIHRKDRAPTLVNADHFRFGHVTTGSVFYRSWFKCIPWSLTAANLREPGDWNRFRKILYLRPKLYRHPVPLLNHYRA
jgi:glycosyltransferase involved in cell wall biosynthesis